MGDPGAISRYDAVAIALHWLIALGIALLIGIGLSMTHLAMTPALKFQLYQLHKSIGVTVMLAIGLRILWRLGHRPPPLPALPRFEAVAAKAMHILLYLLMVLQPLTGWAMVSASPFNLPTVLYGIVPWPHLPVLATLANKAPVETAMKFVHGKLGWLLLALILFHVAAALRHHFVLRDGILRRMLPMRRIAPGLLVVAALLSASGRAAAGEWAVDSAHSHLGFSGTQVEIPFHGGFAKWRAEISFDPAHPEAGRAKVTIDLSSANTGDTQRDTALPQSDWFDVAGFPEARFEADHFVVKGGDAYDAPGRLTIRGITQDVVLPFTLKVTGNRAEAKGHLDLMRTSFGVGQGVWSTGQWVALDVGVDVDIVATAAN